MDRVFFDGNTADGEGFILWHLPSINDLSKIEGQLEGRHVIIYMPSEWECEAVLSYDQHQGYWKATPIGESRSLEKVDL